MMIVVLTIRIILIITVEEFSYYILLSFLLLYLFNFSNFKKKRCYKKTIMVILIY